MVKIRDIPNQILITNYSFVMYAVTLIYLAMSLRNDKLWRNELRKKRGLRWDVLNEVTRNQRSSSLRQFLASGFRVKREIRTKSSEQAMAIALFMKGVAAKVVKQKEARLKKNKAAMKPEVAKEKEAGSSSRGHSDRSQANTSDIAPKTASPPTSEPALLPRPATPSPGRAHPLAV